MNIAVILLLIGIFEQSESVSSQIDCNDTAIWLDIFPEAHTVRKNGDFDFLCFDRSTVGSPIKWEREDGKPLPMSAKPMKNGLLRFSQPTKYDQGNYICRSIACPSKEKTACLYVELPLFPVIITPKPVDTCIVVVSLPNESNVPVQ